MRGKRQSSVSATPPRHLRPIASAPYFGEICLVRARQPEEALPASLVREARGAVLSAARTTTDPLCPAGTVQQRMVRSRAGRERHSDVGLRHG